MSDQPAAVIDHRYYPHIMTIILNSSSTRALKALRATSKDFKDQADRRLLAHAEFRNRLCAPFEDGESMHLASQEHSRVRVLDVHAVPAYLYSGHFAATTAANPYGTVRYMAWNNNLNCWMDAYGRSFWRLVLFGPVFEVQTNGLRRIVLNVIDRTADILNIEYYFDDTHIVEWDLVVVFPRRERETRISCAEATTAISRLVKFFLVYTPPERLTLVGLPDSIKPEDVVAHLGEDSYGLFELVSDYGSYLDASKYTSTLDLVKAVRRISWETFCEESPHVGLETNPNYRLTPEEMDAVVRGDVARMEALGL